jgi:hypothetical protein
MSPVRNSVQIGSNPAIIEIDSTGVYLVVVADQGSGTTSRASIPDSGTPMPAPFWAFLSQKLPVNRIRHGPGTSRSPLNPPETISSTRPCTGR